MRSYSTPTSLVGAFSSGRSSIAEPEAFRRRLMRSYSTSKFSFEEAMTWVVVIDSSQPLRVNLHG